MASMIEMLMDQLGGDTLSQVSRQVGIPEQDTEKAVPKILAILTGALARNTSKGDGASALSLRLG